MAKVAFLLISDGRHDYRERTLESAKRAMPEPDWMIEIDDSSHELGFAGAIQAGWDRIIAETDADYVFHCEGDFTFNRPVPLHRMIGVLERHRHLAQLVLKRQPWNHAERAAGGIVEQHPDDYTQRTDQGDIWTEHRRFWSTNPCVYPVGFCYQGWPQEPQSEGMFTHRLLADPDLRFAFWGAKYDQPMVEHIGHERAGHGY